MKFWLIVLSAPFIISCKNSTRIIEQSKQEHNFKDAIIYYKPDYSNIIDTVLSSGETDKEANEIWGINVPETKNLPAINYIKIDFNKAILIAEQYLKNRFNPIELQFKSIVFEVANKNKPNQFEFITVTFSYDQEKYIQMVPMLLDGKIILSNKE